MAFKQFFPEPRLHTANLRVNGVGLQEPMRPGLVSRPRGTGDYLFMLYYDPVELGCGREIRSVPALSFILWPPNYRQHYGNPAAPYTHTWLHGDGAWIADLLADLHVPVDTPLPVADPAFFERAIVAIHAEMNHPRGSDSAIVRNLIENALRELTRQLPLEDTRGIPAALIDAKRFIESRYADPLTLAGLAKRACLSVPHFCSEFKRCFGASAIEYAIRLRLNEARHLLQDVNLPITAVARRVGYDDLYYFSKLFKKRFGRAPSRMRVRPENAPRR